jgi:uncharacterized membrane protein
MKLFLMAVVIAMAILIPVGIFLLVNANYEIPQHVNLIVYPVLIAVVYAALRHWKHKHKARVSLPQAQTVRNI